MVKGGLGRADIAWPKRDGRSWVAFFNGPLQSGCRLSEEPDSNLSRGASFAGATAVLLAVLAPALGGGTSPVAVAVLLSGIGLAATARPPRGLKPGFLAGAGVLLASSLDWAWPASFKPLTVAGAAGGNWVSAGLVQFSRGVGRHARVALTPGWSGMGGLVRGASVDEPESKTGLRRFGGGDRGNRAGGAGSLERIEYSWMAERVGAGAV